MFTSEGGGVTHHLSGPECFSVKVREAGAVFWENITVLQLLRVTRGLVSVRVSSLNNKKEKKRSMKTTQRLLLHWFCIY